MNNKELQALVILLEDDDSEVVNHVEEKIKSFGTSIIPFLEDEWEKTFNPLIQERIEDLIHTLQFELVQERLLDWKENDQENLLKGLYFIASYQFPDLEYEELSNRLDELYLAISSEIKDNLNPTEQIGIINNILFDKMKFRANTKNFHSPANSMINSVLESHKGNPISLSSIYLLMTQKIGLPVYGVNLPNLFILTYKTDEKQFYINVFNRGLIFTKEDIHNYIAHLQLNTHDIYFEPCSHLDIIVRYLRNLIVSFEKIGDYHKSDEIKIILKNLNP